MALKFTAKLVFSGSAALQGRVKGYKIGLQPWCTREGESSVHTRVGAWLSCAITTRNRV